MEDWTVRAVEFPYSFVRGFARFSWARGRSVADPIFMALLLITAIDVAWPMDAELVAQLSHHNSIVARRFLAGVVSGFVATGDGFE